MLANQRGRKGKTYTPLLPFDCLTIDIITPGAKTTTGHQHVLVVVDTISRYGWFLPLRSRKTAHVIDTLHKYIFNHWGYPKYLHHDSAGEFTSLEFTRMLASVGVQAHRGTPYNPRSQSVCERLNDTLLNLLRSATLEWLTQWNHVLPYCQLAYNAAFHTALENTPHYIMFGRDANLSYDILFLEGPQPTKTQTDRAKIMAHCLRLSRASILGC